MTERTLEQIRRELANAQGHLGEAKREAAFWTARVNVIADDVKRLEIERLFNKLGTVDDRLQDEIRRSFERLVNKLLHPPLESLRDEAQTGTPHGLLDALKRLFRLAD